MSMRNGIIALVGAVGLALAAASAVSAQSGDAIPGGTYRGTGVDTSGACQEGEIRLGAELGFRLNDHGTQIVGLDVTDLVTPLGDFEEFTIPVAIRISEDGSFDQEFDPLNLGLALVHFQGQFEGESVSGSFSVEVDGAVECAGTFSAQGEPPPERPTVTYFGEIEAVDGDCGGGDIDITVSGSRISVGAIMVRNLDVHGTPTSGAATFAEGTVPIAEDGSFGWTYFPGSEGSQEIAVIGTVSFASVSGAVTVSPSECGAMPFSGRSPLHLGFGGTGTGASRATHLSLWFAVLGAVGVTLMLAGAALRRGAA